MLREVFAAMGVSVAVVGFAPSAGAMPNVLTEQGKLVDQTTGGRSPHW